jgi:Leucine-rich repeat (LRR) protein
LKTLKHTLLIIILLSGLAMRAHAQLLDSLALAQADEYTDLAEALKDPDKVVKLSLRKQKLKAFPEDIYRFKNLQYLDLGKNHLKEVPENIDTLQKLQVLILSRNSIEFLPREIGKLKNLKILNVNQNELATLPPQLGNLEKLEYLDLWSNNISSWPDQMKYLKSLRVMDLRVILINDADQKRIQDLLPHTKIYFSPSCKCQY